MFNLRTLVCLVALSSQVIAQSTACSGQIISSGGRKIGIVIDSSGSMADTDPKNFRITAGKQLAAALLSSDRVTVIDFDDSHKVLSPLGPPSTANFAGIDASGGTYIAGGLKAAIDEITKVPTDATTHVSGIVVLTDGEDNYVSDLITQLKRAASLGIRVSFGFLSADLSVQDPKVLAAIIQTGGTYSTITDATAITTFISLVQSHGLTDNDGATASTLLLPGLVTAGNVSSAASRTYTYDALAGETLNFTLQAVSAQAFDLTLQAGSSKLGSARTDKRGIASIQYDAAAAIGLQLVVSTTNSTSGLFTVQISSSVNRTINVCPGTTTTTAGPTLTPTIIPTSSAVIVPTRSANISATATATGKPPIYTGAAGTVEAFAVAAALPALLLLGL